MNSVIVCGSVPKRSRYDRTRLFGDGAVISIIPDDYTPARSSTTRESRGKLFLCPTVFQSMREPIGERDKYTEVLAVQPVRILLVGREGLPASSGLS